MTLGFSPDKAEEDFPGKKRCLYRLKLTLLFLVLYNSAIAMFPCSLAEYFSWGF